VAREKLNFSNTPAVKPGDLKVGEEVVGRYIGLKVINIPGQETPSTLIRLTDKDGEEFGLWANTSLRFKLNDMTEGEVYAFVALGPTKNPKTNRTFDAFDVFKCTPDELEQADSAPEPEPVAAGNGRKGRK
jgi:hypothetical protein